MIDKNYGRGSYSTFWSVIVHLVENYLPATGGNTAISSPSCNDNPGNIYLVDMRTVPHQYYIFLEAVCSIVQTDAAWVRDLMEIAKIIPLDNSMRKFEEMEKIFSTGMTESYDGRKCRKDTSSKSKKWKRECLSDFNEKLHQQQKE